MAIQNNLTNSSIRKYLPSKVISGSGTSITPLEGWLYDDGYGDPWWQGMGAAPYRWVLDAEVSTSTHSSHLTRVPQQYNGLDIQPGMWVFADGEPKAVRVVSVVSASETSIKCVVEDVDRYNTFTDAAQTGVGVFSPTRTLIFFEIGDDGLPVLNPLPANTDISTVSQVEARFRVFNPVVETRFFQINHGFKEGQVLKLNNLTGKFENAGADDLYVVGTVTAVGPGPNYFYLSPSTKVITNLEPGLPGNVGDVIYIDYETGDRTTTKTPGDSPMYIKLTASVPSFTVGLVSNPTSYDGTAIKLNNHQITFNSVEGVVDTATIISTINANVSNTGTLVSLTSPPTSSTGWAMYPNATPTTGFKFKVNGVLTECQPPSVNFGDSGMIGWWDVIRSVNEQTTLHGVYATFDPYGGTVIFTKDTGGDIVFENVSPTITSGDDKTFTDLVGVPTTIIGGSADKLMLTRMDGGGIVITEVSGSFIYETGLTSSSNGVLPIALVVDKTMNAAANYVVSDIVARDALVNLRTGDQVFVQNAGNGEWALFVKTGESWTMISDQDSANTDANTLTETILYDSTSPFTIGAISDQSRVVNVTVVVEEAFDSITATLSIGDGLVLDSVMKASGIDLSSTGTYETTSDYENTSGSDVSILAFLSSGGATKGRAKIMVSYL